MASRVSTLMCTYHIVPCVLCMCCVCVLMWCTMYTFTCYVVHYVYVCVL